MHAVALGATLFCASFLLFLIEPIVAKELLPWFGGAANVWATCLVFFQLALLLGYAFADLLVHHLSLRRQQLALAVLAVLALIALPIVPAAHWKPHGPQSPTLWVLGALTTTVGLPFVLMAATSPLVQSWYARAFPGRTPYRLFALSNLASMLALLSYPTLLEPWLGTHRQSLLWSAAYAIWALLLIVCAGLVTRLASSSANAMPERLASEDAAPRERAGEPAVSWPQLASWVGLAALGSLLLIAVTNHLTRDVAAIPLLWVAPLAVYLLTFIVSFQEPRWLTRQVLAGCGVTSLAGYCALTLHGLLPGADDRSLPVTVQIAALCAVLAFACLFCHGTLVRLKPGPRALTRFYLSVSLGGALGSMLIGLAAPALLRVDLDFEIGMLACAAVLAWRTHGSRPGLALGALGLLLAGSAAWLETRDYLEDTVLARRNFYGALRVQQWNAGRAGTARSLSNGAILHGTQFFAPDARRRPTEYYAEGSGVGRALAVLQREGVPRRLGVIGLGVGTLAAYGRPGDVIRFYELNPAVLAIARSEFTYLKDSAAHIDVSLGDARLSLEREPPQRFDLLVVDAFSSDAIPVHLLTREALATYLRHLAPQGIIAFHTSNRYVDLLPVVEGLAEAYGLAARVVESDLEDTFNTSSSWVLVTRDAHWLEAPQIKPAAALITTHGARVWTDDFSDLIEYLR